MLCGRGGQDEQSTVCQACWVAYRCSSPGAYASSIALYCPGSSRLSAAITGISRCTACACSMQEVAIMPLRPGHLARIVTGRASRLQVIGDAVISPSHGTVVAASARQPLAYEASPS